MVPAAAEASGPVLEETRRRAERAAVGPPRLEQEAANTTRAERPAASTVFSPYALAAALSGAVLFMSRRRRVG